MLVVVQRKSEIEIRIPYSDSKKRSSVYHKIVRVTAQNLVPHMKCRTWNHGLSVIISPEDSDENQEVRSPRNVAIVGWLCFAPY